MPESNATFHSFRPSGKWYASGRGYLSSAVYKMFDKDSQRRQILEDNDGKFPGLRSSGSYFTWVVLGDEDLDYGWPLLLTGEVS